MKDACSHLMARGEDGRSLSLSRIVTTTTLRSGIDLGALPPPTVEWRLNDRRCLTQIDGTEDEFTIVETGETIRLARPLSMSLLIAGNNRLGPTAVRYIVLWGSSAVAAFLVALAGVFVVGVE
jgi:hypothetical protein